MNIAILGFGKQGRSAYEYWGEGNKITVCDGNEQIELPDNVEAQLGPDHLHGLDKFDLIVRSPIIHPKDIAAANTPAILDKVTTVTDEFFKVCPSKNIIGVTGTKGKGTTSTLIAKMLEADGQTVHLGGNIGTPPLELLKNNIGSDDWVVLELANFQLIDLKHSPHLAVCLLVVPEHLDWHTDMEEYITAKQQLFARQVAGDIAIYYTKSDISKQVASAGLGTKIPYFGAPGAEVEGGKIIIQGQVICDVSELKLLGQHNWQNACAAVTAVWQVSQNVEAMRSVLIAFSGLPHRIEFVREVDSIKFYNDSFATGLHATEAAIDAVLEPKVMILGGFERNLPLEHFGKFIKDREDKFRKLLIIGESAERLAATLKAAGFTNFVIGENLKTMPEIVKKAQDLAETGDAVVLSPGFASFDMFNNFEERGLKYKEAVNNL